MLNFVEGRGGYIIFVNKKLTGVYDKLVVSRSVRYDDKSLVTKESGTYICIGKESLALR